MVRRYSATQIDMFFTCPESYRRRYIEGDKVPPGIAAVSGSSFHKAPEMSYNFVLEGKGHLTVDDCRDVAATEYNKRLSEGGIYLTREEEFNKSSLLSEGKDNAVRAAEKFRRDVAETFQPVLVEHEFTINIPGIGKPVLGYIDLFSESRELTDWKLSKAFNQGKADESTASTIYGEAIKQLSGAPPARTSFQVFKPLKKEVKHTTFETTRDDSDLVTLAKKVQIMERMIAAGDFPGAPPGHWKCAAGGKWCGFWASCPLISDRQKRLPNMGD